MADGLHSSAMAQAQVQVLMLVVKEIIAAGPCWQPVDQPFYPQLVLLTIPTLFLQEFVQQSLLPQHVPLFLCPLIVQVNITLVSHVLQPLVTGLLPFPALMDNPVPDSTEPIFSYEDDPTCCRGLVLKSIPLPLSSKVGANCLSSRPFPAYHCDLPRFGGCLNFSEAKDEGTCP